MESDSVLNSLWVEKYRPRTLEDVVLTDETKRFFEACIQRQEIPHMLFYGPPGSGKTTTARIFVSSLIHNSMDVLFLNGSDTNGVDYFRNTVVEFCKTPPMSGKIKCIFIDEGDGLSLGTQQLLRNAMETYAANVRFILTCNFLYKIIDPLQSRFTMFEMKTMPEDFVIGFVEKILTKENIQYKKDDVVFIVKNLIPDIRKIINLVQRKCVNNVLTAVKYDELVTVENKIIGMIVELCDSIGTSNVVSTSNRVLPTIMDTLKNEKAIELGKIYDTLFAYDKLPAWAKIKVNEYANKHTSCFNQMYNFMAMCYDILQTGTLYMRQFSIKK